MVNAIEQRHAPIRDLFGTGAVHRIQAIESRTMVRLLLQVMTQGHTALPIHDAVLVPASIASAVRATMDEVFEEVVGRRGEARAEL